MYSPQVTFPFLLEAFLIKPWHPRFEVCVSPPDSPLTCFKRFPPKSQTLHGPPALFFSQKLKHWYHLRSLVLATFPPFWRCLNVFFFSLMIFPHLLISNCFSSPITPSPPHPCEIPGSKSCPLHPPPPFWVLMLFFPPAMDAWLWWFCIFDFQSKTWPVSSLV